MARRPRAFVSGAVVTLALMGAGCASKPSRDSVPTGRDERQTDEAEASYEHMARRRHVTVALAEARGLDRAESAGAVESLADRLEECSTDAPTGGVVRVVARVGDDGMVDGLNVRVEPGHAPIALRCVIAPIKLLVFRNLPPVPPRPDGSTSRGLAIEAQWSK